MRPLLALCLLVALATPASAQRLAVDLAAGTINRQAVCGLSVDEITDLLGRPSVVVDRSDLVPEIGIRLLYHPAGLEVWYARDADGVDLHLGTLGIRLARERDEENGEVYAAFPGSIAGGVSGSWKAADVERAFAAFPLSVRTPEEHRRQLEEVGIYRQGAVLNYLIRADFGDHGAAFVHERNTLFLERVTMTCGD